MKYFLCMLGLIVSTTITLAQVSSLGPAVGYNYAWISSDGDADTHGRSGFNAGVNYIFSNAERLGFGIGAFYSQEGNVTEVAGRNQTAKLDYIRIPLKGIYFFNTLAFRFRPKVFIGPSFAFLTKAEVEYNDLTLDIKDDLESFDLGVTVGGGINYKLATRTWLNFDVAYNHGFIDLNGGEGESDSFNRNIGATLGVSFGF